MEKHHDIIDRNVEALNRVDDQRLASLSHSPAAQALYEEVTSMSREPRTREENAAAEGVAGRRPRSRRRLIWQGAVVVGAAAIVLAVLSIVNVFGADGPSIVEKAVAALDPGQNAIVHVKITTRESGTDGYSSGWTEESWSRTASPFTSRMVQTFEGSPVAETVTDNTGFSQVFDAAANIIYQPPQSGVFQQQGDQSFAYRTMILEMLNAGEAVVEGSETIDGRECLRIAATKDYGTAADGTKYGTWYLIDEDTKNPVEWRMTRDGGKAVVMHFDIYEQLPADAEHLALLDLAVQHPGATLNTSLADYQKSLGLDTPGPAGDPSVKQ